MVVVSIRDLTHNFSSYLKEVKSGKRITILERNVPIAELTPLNPNVIQPGWKRPIKRIKVPGVNFAKEVIKERRQSR